MSGPPPSTAASPPVLLTSLTSAVLMGRGGEVSSVRETRGTPFDWGGVYGQLVRLTGPWSLAIGYQGRLLDLGSSCTSGGPVPGGWQTRHRWNEFELVQDVVAVPSPSGGLRRVCVTATGPGPVRLRFLHRFAPFLLPVLVEGIRPVVFRVAPHSGGVRVRQQGFALHLTATGPVPLVTINGEAATALEYRGSVMEIGLDQEVEVAPGQSLELRWQIAGGLARDLEASERSVGAGIPDPEAVGRVQAGVDRAWRERTPELDFPDAPWLSAAYDTARSGMRTLYTSPGEGLVGFVAGYPWYSALWCRDLAIMLSAALWLGDAEWVERSLSSVFRFQSERTLPILGGEPGELPMQVAPGPTFLYGTSDTTLRFPEVVEQYHRHRGDRGAATEWADALHRIVLWGRRRVDPATGLFRHGNEAEAIGSATAALSRVRFGIDSPDTTIWDSADRRDHAIDVQVLWWSTLRVTERMLRLAGASERAAECTSESGRMAEAIRTRYPRPAGDYLFDSFRSGRPVDQLRPNALRAVSAGLVSGDLARRVVDRAAQPDLTTPWGVRTLASSDPSYDPRAYHEGQVWTIATAWAADAAFVVGRMDLAMGYLRTIADRYVAEEGFANECYRGDRAEAFDSCYLLGFSIAPFLNVLFERLWGLSLEAGDSRVQVRPQFPATWRSARLQRLRVGAGYLDLDWTPERLRATWHGPGSLTVDSGGATQSVPSGGTGEFAPPPESLDKEPG